jgi:predicted metal-dependent HD superfamily phosphohydrolase
MPNLDQLNQKWQQCWLDRSQQQEIDRVFQLLINAYTKSDRHYHNLDHIYQVLTTIERFGDKVQNPTAVSLAAWFHDFVYDPQASDNEFQSAKLAQVLLTNVGVPLAVIDRTQQLILATQGHQIDMSDRDKCIFLDADLAILGTDPAQYQVYQRSIRREYSWVSDSAYQAGRSQVLTNFLRRDRLYATDLLFDQLESIARFNLEQEIASLAVHPNYFHTSPLDDNVVRY